MEKEITRSRKGGTRSRTEGKSMGKKEDRKRRIEEKSGVK